jgi:hypothetical protein
VSDNDNTNNKNKSDPWRFINSINQNKDDLSEDPRLNFDYNNWFINNRLSYFQETIHLADNMNRHYQLPLKQQYLYLLNTVSKRKRFIKVNKPEEDKILEIVRTHYGYNYRKAKQALTILTSEQITMIQEQNNKGGAVKK